MKAEKDSNSLTEQLLEEPRESLSGDFPKNISQIPYDQLIDIVEFLPDATLVIDREGRVIAWNRAIEEMTGVPKSEMLGKGDYAYSVPFYGSRRPIVIDYAMGSAEGIERLYDYVHKEGCTCFAETYSPILYKGRGAYLWGKATPLYDYEGNVVGAVESIRDLTERKRAEEALRKSEGRLRMLLDTMNEGVGIQNEKGALVYANDKLCRILDCAREQLIGKNEAELFSPRSRADLEEELAARRQSGVSSLEAEMVTSRGAVLPVMISSSPILDENGLFEGTIDTVADISMLRAAESKLRESEEKYRLIFQHTPLGIFHFDEEGTVTACNDKIIEIWGSTKEKFIGFNLLSSLKNRKMRAAVKACLAGRYACYEGNYLSVTGGKITNLKADYGPILSADGAIIGGIGIIEDISERKTAEEALQESESRMRLLSSQLIAAQENERKRIAAELHDSIGSLLSGIKLGVEKALEQATRPGFDPESLRSTVDLVQHAIDESRRITADLRPSMLDDLGAVTTVRWFTRHFQSVYPEISVKTHINLEESDIREPLKIVIFRVVQEAFHNIAKHSGADLVNLKLEKTDERIRLEIEDNGCGFDTSTISDRGKPGLGLISMKERSEFSGGVMSIDSREGSGTLIRACWPIEGEGSTDQSIIRAVTLK